jgi:hypothetical protein
MGPGFCNSHESPVTARTGSAEPPRCALPPATAAVTTSRVRSTGARDALEWPRQATHSGPERTIRTGKLSGKRGRRLLAARQVVAGRGLACWFVMEPPAGIEPATPSLPWNHQEPLCEPLFAQVKLDWRGRSNRFSFAEVMRSLRSVVAAVGVIGPQCHRGVGGRADCAAVDLHPRGPDPTSRLAGRGWRRCGRRRSCGPGASGPGSRRPRRR